MTQYVTSAQNPQIKHIKQLASTPKYRQEHQQTVLDGIHLCDAYLRSGGTPMQVMVGMDSLKNKEVSGILFRLDLSIPVLEVPENLYERVSSLEQGVGMLFVISTPSPEEAPALTEDALLMDAIQDPGNVGAMLRTAAAAGVGDIYISGGSASVWSPKVLRAGMGAHFALRIHDGVDLAKLITESSVPVVATSLDATETLYEKDLSTPHAWLLGNEGAGVSPELLKLCEKNTITIPQAHGVESLNVAAATAVCLFEQRRQRL